jgi:hypothetical protein
MVLPRPPDKEGLGNKGSRLTKGAEQQRRPLAKILLSKHCLYSSYTYPPLTVTTLTTSNSCNMTNVKRDEIEELHLLRGDLESDLGYQPDHPPTLHRSGSLISIRNCLIYCLCFVSGVLATMFIHTHYRRDPSLGIYCKKSLAQ